MTSHNKDNGNVELSKEEKLDYSDVEQGLKEAPNMQEIATVEVPEFDELEADSEKGKKGRKSKSESAVKTMSDEMKLRNTLHCSFCNNPMTMSKKMNYEPVEGLKVPKESGQFIYSTPKGVNVQGGKEGKYVAVFCDDCKELAKNNKKPDGSSAVDAKSVIVVSNKDPNKSIRQMPISDIIMTSR